MQVFESSQNQLVAESNTEKHNKLVMTDMSGK